MKELEDFDWFPRLLRQFQMDYIGFVVSRFNIYEPFINYLKTHKITKPSMFDLCSGSGEPAASIFNSSMKFESLILSDKFPDIGKTFGKGISYIPESYDVLDTVFLPQNTYTMFNAFHHFTDAEKTKLLNQIILSDSRAFIVEILEPGLFYVVKILFATTIGTLLLTPFIKPFSLKRLLFTYIIPVNIITIATDGIISVIKSRTVKQYQKLFQTLGDSIKVMRLKKGFRSLILIEIN